MTTDEPDEKQTDQGLCLWLPGEIPQTKRNSQVHICHHGEHGDKVQHQEEPIETAADECQSLSSQPTGLPGVAKNMHGNVYSCAAKVHDSEFSDENVWNCL